MPSFYRRSLVIIAAVVTMSAAIATASRADEFVIDCMTDLTTKSADGKDASKMPAMAPMPKMDMKVPMPTKQAKEGTMKDDVMHQAAMNKACMDPMLLKDEATVDQRKAKSP